MTLNECLSGPASKAWLEGTAADRDHIRRRADAYDRFQVAFRNRLKQADNALEAVAFNFGAGNFLDATAYLEWFPHTLQSYVYLGFHEYGWPALSAQLHPAAASSAGTYRPCLAGIRQVHGDRHRVIITEAGLARMYKHHGPDDGDVGWLYPPDTVSQDSYWHSLEWYNGVLCGDDYVLGCCLFEVGHSGLWETFRHLGVDNQSQPLRIIPRIAALHQQEVDLGLAPVPAAVFEPLAEVRRTMILGGRVLRDGQPQPGAAVRLLGPAEILADDPQAPVYHPEAVTWTRAVSGLSGNLWTVWQKEVAGQVAGLSWAEFKHEVVAYNPSLRQSGRRFQAGQAYFLPENPAGAQPEVVWDRMVTDFSGDRWACWQKYVKGKVLGLSWPAFRRQVMAYNRHLVRAGGRFQAGQLYWLPRNPGQDVYSRLAVTDSRGRYRFDGLRPGRYAVEVRLKGCTLLQQIVDVTEDHQLDLRCVTGSN
jgi:hypothetical protein